ncbi:hypothetical protein CANINC_004807 [Pichia inconspicua]|uniref:E3 ubiquitin-protein ligase n=1 Tax=Pichia inconspicua TaxID=52247 RepID=A0A4T0WWQ3_9ASCO|nr:hypothetical protein CANINC_004807 [[Candida] inconspicua]
MIDETFNTFGDCNALKGVPFVKKCLLTMASKFDYKYTDAARQSLLNLLNTSLEIDPDDLLIEKSEKNHYGKVCGHRFVRGETCWRCLTCGYDESCALCSSCFHSTSHQGHDVHKSIIQRDFAGCCDCGDEEAYKNLSCPFLLQSDTIELKSTINEQKADYINELIGALIDFILDSMSYSFSSLSPHDSVDQIRLQHEMSALDGEKYSEIEHDTNKYALVLYSDQIHQYRDAVQRIRFVTGKVREFAEMVATRCNTHGRAVVMISENIQYLLKKQEILTSTGLTACIINTREVFREEMCDNIIEWLDDFMQTTLVRKSIEVRSAIARAFLLPYHSGCKNQALNFYHDDVLLNSNSLRANRINDSTLIPKWDISDSLKVECQYLDNVSNDHHGSRLQFMFFFDVRFCKKARVQYHDIIVQCLAKSPKYCHMLVAQYIDIFEIVLTLFLKVDREPELNIMPLLSTQIFSSPSNDALVLKHGDVSKMIGSIYNFVTTGQTTIKLLSEPNTLTESDGVILSTLKSRKWAHVLLDLTYIITRNPEIENIFTFFLSFPQYVYLLKVFQSKPTFIREATQHVEYENQDYTVFFNAVSVISHLSENIGRVLNRIPKEKLLSHGNPMDCWYHSYSKSMKKPFTETLYIIIVRQLILTTFEDQLEDDEMSQNKVIEKEAGVVFKPYPKSNDIQVVDFDIMKGPVSFLHPLHTMLSWMIEMDQSIDTEKSMRHLLDIIEGEYQYYITEKNMEQAVHPKSEFGNNYLGVLGVLDIPLRKIVLSSQIKVGLWVRNGISLKNQMSLYRYGGSREFGYMRDLFLCQIYAAFLQHKDLVAYTFLDRWNIIPWVNLGIISSCYNDGEIHFILEEFVLFLINLVTEDLHLHKVGYEELTYKMIEKEIVQALCYDAKCYNDIVCHIPEHIQTLKKFPIVFEKTVMVVKNCEDNYEEKLYKLKPSLLDIIDPFYVYYSANRRDKCIKKMKEHISKRDSLPLTEVYVAPKQIDWKDCFFGKISDILLDQQILLFLQKTLAYSREEMMKQEVSTKENYDSLFLLTLHLIHIILKSPQICDIDPKYLIDIFKQVHEVHEANILTNNQAKLKAVMKLLFSLLVDMKVELKYEVFGFDVNKVHESFAQFGKNRRVDENSFEKKRKIAKMTKRKLLAKMERQRQRFAENHKVDDPNDSGTDLTQSIESLSDIKLTSGSSALGTTSEIQSDSNISSSMYLDTNEYSEEQLWKFPEHNCLLCHLPSSDDSEIFGVFSYITESNVFRYVPAFDNYWFYKGFGGSVNLDTNEQASENLRIYTDSVEQSKVFGPGFPGTAGEHNTSGYVDNMAVFTSCSHGMHARCFKQYYESAVSKQLSQITRTTPENIQRREFICPLCKAVNNAFIPVCYSVNSKTFSDNFAEKLEAKHLINPKLSDSLLKNPVYLDKIRDELIANVKANIKPSDWFINKIVNELDGTKAYSFKESSKIPFVLKNCLVSVTMVSPPFESFGLTLSRTIDALEIALRGEGYKKKVPDHPLVIYQLNNRSLTSLRVWLQISEIFKSTLGVPRGEPSMNDNQHLYPQSLLGLYSNLFNDNDLMFNGQDYFAALIHCEEVKCIGYPFQKLIGIFLIKHIQQSLMKVMVTLTKRRSFVLEESTEILKTSTFKGDRNRFMNIVQGFMDLDQSSDLLLDVVYSMLIKLVTPFMRKALILAYAKYAIFDDDTLTIDVNMMECDRLSKAMKLPYFDEIIDSLDPHFFLEVTDENKAQLFDSRIAYPGTIELLHLPDNLNDFYSNYYDCLPENQKPDDPAICLFCGEVMDLQKNRYGDDYGSCTMHIKWECMNGGKGIFFIPRSNCCLLLDNGKGSFIDGPYRDDYGEIDKEYKKGHEVHLSKKRYKELMKRVWLNHNIPNTIAQKLENLTDTGGWSTL